MEYSRSAASCALFSHRSMWGMKPSGLAPCIRHRISCLASSGSTPSSAIAWNALSQNHWNGYVVGEGQTKSYRWPAQADMPRCRLPASTRRASAATLSQSERMSADYPTRRLEAVGDRFVELKVHRCIWSGAYSENSP